MARHKGLYKRGNVWWIRYAGLDGRIRLESSGATSFRTAQDTLIQRRKDVMEGKEPIQAKRIANHSFRELAEHYEAWGVGRQRGFRTKKGHIKQLLEVFGTYPLRAFSTRIVEEWQTHRLAINKPSTANRMLATLKHMFTKAVEWDMVEEGALKRIRKVRMPKENNRRLRYLSKEECQALVNASPTHLKPVVVTAINTGMRKGEILSLEWERNIDLKHGFILLDVTKNGERREIPINQVLRETLQGLVRRLDTPYVFVDGDGNRFKDVKRSFNTALRKAGIKDFRFHDLRHTFASHLVMAGVDITTIKELLGHKTLAMTLRYAHLAPTHKVKALQMLEGLTHPKPTIQLLYNLRGNEKAGNA